MRNVVETFYYSFQFEPSEGGGEREDDGTDETAAGGKSYLVVSSDMSV